MKSDRRILIFFACIAISLSLIAFRALPNIFYASDEFLGLGAVRYYGITAGLQHGNAVKVLLGDYRTLGTLLTNVFLYYSGYNMLPYAVMIYILQACNIVLLGFLTLRLTKRRIIAAVSMLVFALPATAQQTMSWYASGLQTLSATFFVLLALLVGITAIEKRSTKLTILSWFAGYIGLLIKDSTFFVFIMLALLPFFVRQNKRSKHPYRGVVFFGIVTAVAAFVKILPSLGVRLLIRTAWNSFYYPLIALGQFFVPYRFISRAGITLLPLMYRYPQVMGNTTYVGGVIVGDIVSLLVSFTLLFGLGVLYCTDKVYRKLMRFPLFFYVLSFLPVALYLSNRESSNIESRYLYIPFVAVAFLTGLVIDRCITFLRSRIRSQRIVYTITGILLGIFLFKQVTVIQREVNQAVLSGNDIRSTMTLIRQTVTRLPDDPVFYITSDRDYFYPNNKLPFQLGTGYMVMVTLDNLPQIPEKLVAKNALAGYFEQGYLESGGKKFGYYWDKQALTDSIRKNDIRREQIVGLYYHSDTRKIEDISESLRKELFIQ